ncbi:hypothetical protein BN159_3379 [Streptomyces davaonensis JCM 4913]|uniref:Secreted protein n=1 Tax=Streptomyces davaonensis (strain DSM 101723 / JCM 4913 / KCC S-0913 / 768) TaxID=1214101 RepID=K4R341_STRDJ|nr:DUF2500 family protein [Streptomyces davaonensis]CCK27758.1 hypothetical protein BN159_3379 [Streptomyces davaonensis JCM 4913]
MKRTLTVLVALAALTVPLAGCSDSKDVTGTVVDKETDQECSKSKKKKKRSCHTEYELTVRTKNGDRTEVDVDSDDYNACSTGAQYPKCTKS